MIDDTRKDLPTSKLWKSFRTTCSFFKYHRVKKDSSHCIKIMVSNSWIWLESVSWSFQYLNKIHGQEISLSHSVTQCWTICLKKIIFISYDLKYPGTDQIFLHSTWFSLISRNICKVHSRDSDSLISFNCLQGCCLSEEEEQE